MMAMRAIGLALGLISGIVLATLTDWSIAPLLLTAVGIVGAGVSLYAYIQERRWHEWPTAAVLAAAFACTFPLGYWRTATTLGPPDTGSLSQVLSQLEDGSPISIRGQICHEPELRKAGQLDLKVCVEEVKAGEDEDAAWQSISSGKLLVRVYAQKSSAAEAFAKLNALAAPEGYGYRIELESRYLPVAATKNPGEFDYGRFLKQGGLTTRLRCHVNRVEILERTRGKLLTEVALLAKTDFLNTYKQTIRDPASRLAAAATLGTRRAVENITYRGRDIAKMFRHAGVGHVLAVSGLHVSVVTILLYSLFRMGGMRPRVFVPPLILFLILFALLTGARPSSVRAVIMNAVVLITIAYFRTGLRRATAIGLSLSSCFILIGNPMVLYAPSFLLSYGAVISLVLLAPPMDRWLKTLRGFALLFFLGWFILVMTIAALRFHLLIDPWNLLGLLGLLWMGASGGAALNHRCPRGWRVGLERVPAALRMFFGAQLAIQIGMMVPMSAWFFGQFPVAGVLVNLIAIPLVGLVVQLGMLTGLLGLLPGIGPTIALPFGAATSVIGEGFYALAYAGATWFPFPATPRPSATWIMAYYAGVGAVLLFDLYRVPLLSILYRRYPAGGIANRTRRLFWLLPLLLTALPLINCLPGNPNCTGIHCLASGRYPIVTLASSDGSAVVINAGAGLTGERLLFDALRAKGAARVEKMVLCSADPRAGIEGCASLLGKMPVKHCLLPVMPDADQDFLEAVGDDYLLSQAVDGERWALQYETAFDELQRVAAAKGMRSTAIQPGELAVWKNGELRALERYAGSPRRFAASAKTPILAATLHGLRWIIITDTDTAAVRQALADGESYDVVVVPDLSSRSSYKYWLKQVISTAKPRVLIISGETEDAAIDIEALTQDHTPEAIYMTGRDGAVFASFEDNDTTVVKAHLSGQSVALQPL